MKRLQIRMSLSEKTILLKSFVAAAFCSTMALTTACNGWEKQKSQPETKPAEEQPIIKTTAEEVKKTPNYVGDYLDEDVNEPNLIIRYRQNDGKYDVIIGIYRLTCIEDGVGTLTNEGLRFTGTDSSENPISGIITLKGDTATVTFTNSTWEYLPNGSQFLYFKQRQ